MSNVAQITIAGYLGGDAETKQVNDKDVTEINLAVNDRQKNTMWFRVSIWGNYGNALAPYLLKGATVTVIGDLSQNTYNTQSGETRISNNVFARHVIVAGNSQQSDNNDIPF